MPHGYEGWILPHIDLDGKVPLHRPGPPGAQKLKVTFRVRRELAIRRDPSVTPSVRVRPPFNHHSPPLSLSFTHSLTSLHYIHGGLEPRLGHE